MGVSAIIIIFGHRDSSKALKNEPKYDSCSHKTPWTQNTSIKRLSATVLNVDPKPINWMTLVWAQRPSCATKGVVPSL